MIYTDNRFWSVTSSVVELLEISQSERKPRLKTEIDDTKFKSQQRKGNFLILHLIGRLAKTRIIDHYYMSLCHKDWELPNSRIWLIEMDIDRGLDFPI